MHDTNGAPADRLPGRLAYLHWLAVSIWLPELVLALAAQGALRRRWRTFALLSGVGLLIGIPWDAAGFRLGYWSLRDGAWLGRRLLGLPVEEWLFCLTAPWLWGAAAMIALEVERAAEARLSGPRPARRRSAAAGRGALG